MRLLTAAVTLLASLLSLSAGAVPITTDTDMAPAFATELSADTLFSQFQSEPVLLNTTFETVTPVEVDAAVSGYRFSRFVSFMSVARFCEVPAGGDNITNSCYDTPDDTRSVPEPGTMLLLGTGLLLVAASRRRRRFSAPPLA